MIQKFQKVERIFIPANPIKTDTKNLKNFLNENFNVPENELERIYEFINDDSELLKIIYELPNLIQSELSYEKIEIKLDDEFQEEVLIVNVCSALDIKSVLRKENQFIHQLYERYDEESADKILILIEG